MPYTGIIGLFLIVLNVIVSYRGFRDEAFFDRYKFDVSKVLVNREYKRFITSGFLHVGWMHLIFNMISLYAFSESLEIGIGALNYGIIYVASLIGGNTLALLVHKSHGDYTSAGASGAICGVIFASIALFPGMGIGMFGIELSMPAWLYGIIYVAYSIYGIRSKSDNIGHEAHLGGALIGMAVALIMRPSALAENYVTILIIAVPTIVFISLIIRKPHILLIDNLHFKKHRQQYGSIDHRYNAEKARDRNEIDRILDKISRSGMGSLSRKEKERLEEYSRSAR